VQQWPYFRYFIIPVLNDEFWPVEESVKGRNIHLSEVNERGTGKKTPAAEQTQNLEVGKSPLRSLVA